MIRRFLNLFLGVIFLVGFTSCNTTKNNTNEFSTNSSSDINNSQNSYETEDEDIEGLRFRTKNFNQTLSKDGPLRQNALPSLGNPKFLVIPINLDARYASQDALEEIRIAFRGTSEQTGWESVNSYYKKASYGKLDIDCVVLNEWFKPSKSARTYERKGDIEGTTEILNEALNYYETKLDYNDFDYNNDGYIDNVWMVYSHKVDYINTKYYWAFQTVAESQTKYDGKMAGYYGWAGIEFMHEKSNNYPCENIKVDAHTFIHESGHCMGLDDYYDYDEKHGCNRGMYGADMMDRNIGDHCSMSKIMLGWIDPIIVYGSGSGTYELESFTKTGQVLLISNHNYDTIFDEYFLIEFYTNEGLNENDTPILDDESNTANGIRILHADASIFYDSNGNITTNGDKYYPGSAFKYDNTGTACPFIEMLRADYQEKMSDTLDYKSLFIDDGKVFGEDIYSDFKLNDRSNLFFTLRVNTIENGKCSVTITFKN